MTESLSSNFSFYRIVTPPKEATSSKAALKSRMVKVVTADPSISHDMVKKTLEGLADKFSEDKSFKEVVITRGAPGSKALQVRLIDLKGAYEDLAPAQRPTEMPLVKVQRLRTDFSPAKTWVQKFKRDVADLHPTGTLAFGIVIVFETLIFPLTGIGYALFALGHSVRTSLLAATRDTQRKVELQKLLGPSSYDSFLESMKVMHKIGTRLGSTSEIYQALDSAIMRGDDIKNIIEGTLSHDDFWTQFSSDLEHSTEANPLAVPCGSFAGETFVPSVLIIHKGEFIGTQQQYVVKKLSFDPSGQVSSEKTQVLHNFVFTHSSLKTFVSEAVNLIKVPPMLTKEEQQRAAKAKAKVYPPKRLPLNPISECGLEKLLRSYENKQLCAEMELSNEERPWAFASTSSDPLSLLSLFARRPFLLLETRLSSLRKSKETLEKQKAEIPASRTEDIAQKEIEITTMGEQVLAVQTDLHRLVEQTPELTDKAGLLHLYVSELTRKLIKYGHTLTPAQQELYFRNLDEKVKKLERRFVKAYGPTIALQFISTIRTNIDKEVRSALTNMGRKLSLWQKKALSTSIAPAHPKVMLSIPPARSAQISPTATAAKAAISTAGASIATKAKECKSIEDVFSSKTAPPETAITKALTDLRSILASANDLIEAKNYSDARLYLQTALSLLPSVGSTQVLDVFTKAQRKQLFTSITDMQKSFLETKLRLEATTCSTKELVGVFNAKMLSTYLLRKASKEVFDSCIQHILSHWEDKFLPAVNEEKIPFIDAPTPEGRERNIRLRMKELINKHLACTIDSKQKPHLRDEVSQTVTLLKLLGLSEEDLTLLLTQGIPFDHGMAHEILTSDPLLEFARDPSPLSYQRAQSIVSAIKKDISEYSDPFFNGLPFSLAFTSSTPSYSSEFLHALFETIMRIRAGEDEERLELVGDFSAEKVEEESKQKMAALADSPMPELLQQIKLAEFLEKAIVEPEASLYPSLSILSAAKAPELSGLSEQERTKYTIQAKRQLLQNILREMPGRIVIEMKDSPFTRRESLLSITSSDATEEQSLFFHPGLLPAEWGRFTTPVDKTITTGLVGQRYSPISRILCDVLRETKKKLYSSASPHTPPQLLAWAKENPLIAELAPEIEASLASMDAQDPISIVIALRFILDNPLLLSNPYVSARLENILYKKDWLITSFLCYPDFLEKALSLGAFQKVYEDSIKRGDAASAAFLLNLFNHLTIESARASSALTIFAATAKTKDTTSALPYSFIKTTFVDPLYTSNDKEGKALRKLQVSLLRIERSIQSLSSIGSFLRTPSGEKKTLDWMIGSLRKSDNLSNLIRITLHLIPLLGADELAAMNAEDLAFLLFSWRQVQEHASPMTGLGLYFLVQEKMEIDVLPALQKRLQASEKDKKELLGTLLTLELGGEAKTTKPWATTPTEYEYVVSSEAPGSFEYRIDLKRGIIESASQKGKTKLQDIPLSTLKDPHFIQVFQDAALQGNVQAVGLAEIYSTTYRGRNYRIGVDATTKKVLTIEREINGLWFRHLPSKFMSDTSNFGALVQEKGLWQDPAHPLEAWLFLDGEKDADPRLHARSIKLELRPDGNLKEAIASGGKVVCIDATRKLESAFAVCDRKNLLFLQTKDSKQVDEIVFINEGFSLKKKGDIWVPSHKETGWSLAQDALSAVIARFGLGSLQAVMPLVRTTSSGKKEWEYMIWARPIIVSPIKRAVPQLNVASVETPKVISLYRDAQDNLFGSHAAFLYMAMVCFAQGELMQAALLLEQMSGARAHMKADELPLLEELQKQLSTFPASTDRAAAFLLKAELALNRIKREQYRVTSLPETDVEGSLQKTDRTLKLFHRYSLSLESLEKQASLRSSHLILTDEELGEALSLHTHALLAIFSASVEPAAKIKEPLTRPESINPFFVLYLHSLTSPAKKISFETWKAAGLSLTKDLLVNFWSYANLIQEESIDPVALSDLLQDVPVSADADLNYAIDMARRFLLTLAMTCQKDPSFKIPMPKDVDVANMRRILDLKTLSKAQEKMTDQLIASLSKPFDLLLSKAAKESRDPALEKPREIAIHTDKGNVDLKTFIVKLMKSPALSAEEKILYREASIKLKEAGDTPTSATLKEWISHLHEMKVMISAKRHATATLEKIKELEVTEARISAGSFPEVALPDIIDAAALTAKALRSDYCSYSLSSISDAEVESLITTLESPANSKDKAHLLEDIQSIHKGLTDGAAKALIARQKDVRTQKILRFALELKHENKLPSPSLVIRTNVKEILSANNELEKSREKQLVERKTASTLTAFPAPSEAEKVANPMKAREILRLRAGIEEASRENIALIEGSLTSILPLSSIRSFEKTLKEELDAVHGQTSSLRRDIIEAIRPFAGDLGLYPQLSEPLKYSQEEVLSSLLDLYEDGNLNALGAQRTEIEKQITSYLLLSTKAHLIEKALDEPIGSIAQLQGLKEKIDSLEGKETAATSDNARARIRNEITELSLEWKAACLELFKKLDRGYNLTFFSDDKTAPSLNDQPLSRAALVFGYRQKIGVTKEQIAIIKKILADPSALEELRMGLGKSFVISPLVARLMAKQGTLPVVIFTEELIEQSRKDMDKRAYEFRFQRNPMLPAEQLAEEYKTLLEIKTSGRYVVTTIGRLAALENKYHELKGLLSAKKKVLDAISHKLSTADPKDKASIEEDKAKVLAELTELNNELLWIQKIYLFFDPTAHGTRMFVDEVDAVLHISSEINYSEGLSENVDALTHSAGDTLFRKLFTSSDESIVAFAKALATNKQASFPQERLNIALFSLALKLLQDPIFLKKIGVSQLSPSQKEALAAYLCGSAIANPSNVAELITAPRPSFLPVWPIEGEEPTAALLTIAAYKHWFTKTIPTLCTKSYGIDFGLATDGFTTVPMEEGRAKPNTMFGEEAELIGYHLVSYYQEGCSSKEFFSHMLMQIQAKALPDTVWKQWLTDVGMPEDGKPDIDALFTHFKAKTAEGRELRARFLEFMLLQTSSVQLYRKQIPLLVQDIIASRDFSGASGTMNKEALPDSFTKPAKEGDPRSITGDLLMRISMMEEEGITASAGIYTDPLEQMNRLVADAKCKAIINIGAAFVGQTTLDVIATLRATPQGRSRQFIFIHPIEKTSYFWDVGAKAPQPFDKVRDASKVEPDLCVYYFSPADTRGTDFKIPSGYGAVITGPTTTLPKLEQAIWRLRKLGMGHSAKFYVEDSLAARVSARAATATKAGVSIADVITDILEQTVAEDSLSNFKLQAAHPASTVKNHLKDMLIRLHEDSQQSSYELMENPDSEAEYLTGIDSQIAVYDMMRDYFSRVQKMDYKADYEAAMPEDTLIFLSKLYDAEIAKVDKLIEAFEKESSVYAKQAAVALEQAKAELQENQAKLSSKDTAEHLRAVLPLTIASNASLDAGAQSEVQQQQQQTVTSAGKRFVSTSASAAPVDPDRESSDLDRINAAQLAAIVNPVTIEMMLSNKEDRENMNLLEAGDTIYAGVSTPEGMYFSMSASKMLDLGRAQGKFDTYLLDTGSGTFCILTSLDLHITLLMKDKFQSVKIYALSLNSENLLPLVDADPSTSTSEGFLLKVAISKALLGGSVFSEREQRALEKWYKALPRMEREKLFIRIRSFGGVDIADKLQSWHMRAPLYEIPAPSPKEEELTVAMPPKPLLAPAGVRAAEGLVEAEEAVSPMAAERAEPALRVAPSPAEALGHPFDLTSLKDTVNGLSWIFKKTIQGILGFSFEELFTALENARFTEKEMIHLQKYVQTKGVDVEAIESLELGKITGLLQKISGFLKELIPHIKAQTLRKYYDEKVKPPELIVAPVKAKGMEPAPITETEVEELLRATKPTSMAVKAPSRIEPLWTFIVDKGGKGNCGSLSLLDQVIRKKIIKSDGSTFKSQQDLRLFVRDYLISQVDHLARADISAPTPEATLFTAIVGSLKEAQADGATIPSAVREVFKDISLATPLSADQKRTLLNAYAESIATDGFWLDKGFFAIAAAALGKQITIIRPGAAPSSLILSERFPETPIDPASSLFIYYNGLVTGSKGYHFQSVDVSQIQRLSSLVSIDKAEKIDYFLKEIRFRALPSTPAEGRIPVLTRQLQVLRKLYPEVYKATLSLMNEHLGFNLAVSVDTLLTEAQMLGLLDPRFTALTRENIEEKIATSLPPTAVTTPPSEAPREERIEPERVVISPTVPLPPSVAPAPPGIIKKVGKFFKGLFGKGR